MSSAAFAVGALCSSGAGSALEQLVEHFARAGGGLLVLAAAVFVCMGGCAIALLHLDSRARRRRWVPRRELLELEREARGDWQVAGDPYLERTRRNQAAELRRETEAAGR